MQRQLEFITTPDADSQNIQGIDFTAFFPGEMIQHILGHLDSKSLLDASAASQTLYQHAQDPLLWKRLFYREMPKEFSLLTPQQKEQLQIEKNWRTHYEETIKWKSAFELHFPVIFDKINQTLPDQETNWKNLFWKEKFKHQFHNNFKYLPIEKKQDTAVDWHNYFWEYKCKKDFRENYEKLKKSSKNLNDFAWYQLHFTLTQTCLQEWLSGSNLVQKTENRVEKNDGSLLSSSTPLTHTEIIDPTLMQSNMLFFSAIKPVSENCKQTSKFSTLSFFIQLSHPEIVKKALEPENNIKICHAAFRQAALLADPEIIKLILQKLLARIEGIKELQKTATPKQMEGFIRQLKSHQVLIQQCKETLVIGAIKARNENLLKFLISLHINVHKIVQVKHTITNQYGLLEKVYLPQSFLHLAYQTGNANLFNILLNAAAPNIILKNYINNPILHRAIDNGYESSVLRFLITYPEFCSVTNNNQNLLILLETKLRTNFFDCISKTFSMLLETRRNTDDFHGSPTTKLPIRVLLEKIKGIDTSHIMEINLTISESEEKILPALKQFVIDLKLYKKLSAIAPKAEKLESYIPRRNG
ncbi:MAG TPA: F-box-like domain-containing protein [Gammaproteobacteria bacterium]|nr:F-box-like domain-containing protein [Gammaproteobacteria bacterium]